MSEHVERVIDDPEIERVARAIWQEDADAHDYDDAFAQRSWERVKPLYRRRARAAIEAIPGVRCS